MNWFRIYFGNRVQCVKVKDCYSYFKAIVYGVPQGSILGTIVFLIIINSFGYGPFKGCLTSVVSDTALCYNSSNQIT